MNPPRVRLPAMSRRSPEHNVKHVSRRGFALDAESDGCNAATGPRTAIEAEQT